MKPLNSQITYHNYLAMVCSFDDSSWVRMGRTVPDVVSRQFTTACRKYLATLESHRKSWSERAGANAVADVFSNYLYNPICTIAFGHTDHIGLVLIDDIAATTAVTIDSISAMEQVHLASCPKLSSLGIAPGGVFVEPHTLFDGAPVGNDAECYRPC